MVQSAPQNRPKGRAAQPRRKPRRKSRGALAAICALLVTSGLLRLAIGASEAIAREGEGDGLLPERAPAALADAGPPVAPPPADPEAEVGPVIRVADADLKPLIDALNKREERVHRLEREIDIRMQALAVAEDEIDRKLARLSEAEEKLRKTMTLARSAAADDVARLTEVYANMKPKQAAALFEEMDPEFAAGFLAEMRPDAAAAIMAGMSPQAAYLTSVILAGRNADVPQE